MILISTTAALLAAQLAMTDSADAAPEPDTSHEAAYTSARDADEILPLMLPAKSDEPAFAEFAQAPAFGTKGTRRWQIHGGYAFEPADTHNMLGLGGAAISYFFLDNISIDAELNGMYISQRGSDAIAGNFNLLFRWHFINEDTWTIFADVGAGLLLANEPAPAAGSRFNFTPQAGGGVSFDLGNDTRLMTGMRWLHISNARLYSNNPGREHVYVYAGLNFGF